MKLDITIRLLKQRFSIWEQSKRLVRLQEEMPYLFVFCRALDKTGYTASDDSEKEEDAPSRRKINRKKHYGKRKNK